MTTMKKIRNTEIFERLLSIEVNNSISFTVLLTTFSTIFSKFFSFLISNFKRLLLYNLKNNISFLCFLRRRMAVLYLRSPLIHYVYSFPRFALFTKELLFYLSAFFSSLNLLVCAFAHTFLMLFSLHIFQSN